MSRLNDLIEFYQVLASLERQCCGMRQLSVCHGRMMWPSRGIYFFFEEGENRTDTGCGMRVVRVGTHALTEKTKTTLWRRLSQHRGTVSDSGGNHRGSIFRLLVGTSMRKRDDLEGLDSWGLDGGAGKAAKRLNLSRTEVRQSEAALEKSVSQVIGSMPFLWLDVDDAPGPASLRGYLERNAIALLSNYGKSLLDPPSTNWLGHFCNRERVQKSGLWNNNHVDGTYDPDFIHVLHQLVQAKNQFNKKPA